MRKLILAGSTVFMMAAMGMTAFAANTVSAPSAGPGYGYCTYLDDDGDGICDTCANERAHCGHDGHVGACSDADGRGGYYRDDCDGTHRDGCGHDRSASSSSRRTGSGRRGHHGGCH